MNERHPIDERFRRALHDVEVTPPAAVWEGIVRERSKRRSGLLGWAFGLLLLAGGTAAWLLIGSPGGVGDVADGSAAGRIKESLPTTTDPQDGSGAGIAQVQARLAGEPNPTPDPMGPNEPGPKMSGTSAHTSAPARTKGANGPGTVVTPTVTDPAIAYRNTLSGTSTKGPGTHAVALGSTRISSATTVRSTEAYDRMVPRTVGMPLSPVNQDSLKVGPDRLPYVLPRADWWVALEVGRYRVDRIWYGNDLELASALNGTELPHDTWSVGVLGGRSWRSGFSLSIGAAYEASEYTYSHLDSRTRVDSLVVIPYLVTLDTLVFVSDVDTTVYGTTEQARKAGANSMSVIHVPIEAYWHAQHRRWTYGARLGLSGEFITSRAGYTLDADDEGDLYSVDLGQQAYDTRYSTTLTGLVGLDIGYALNEHFGLWATPTYMRGLATWSGDDGPWMLPERLGLRVRLSYTFTRIP